MVQNKQENNIPLIIGCQTRFILEKGNNYQHIKNSFQIFSIFAKSFQSFHLMFLTTQEVALINAN